jgi:hypothetical protein
MERMRWKFDTPFGRELYSRRMGTVEPVFANLTFADVADRITGPELAALATQTYPVARRSYGIPGRRLTASTVVRAGATGHCSGSGGPATKNRLRLRQANCRQLYHYRVRRPG